MRSGKLEHSCAGCGLKGEMLKKRHAMHTLPGFSAARRVNAALKGIHILTARLKTGYKYSRLTY